MLDLLIIGGGPAGLTASIYAARFRLSVLILDAGGSRAAQIPCTRNHSGFPGGISGSELLKRMRDQSEEFGVQHLRGRAFQLGRPAEGFTIDADIGRYEASTVLISTGVTNHRPQMSDDVHDEAVRTGRLRYCPVCDGYEVTDQRVAVIGEGSRGAKEAQFLRAFTRQVTLISPSKDAGLDDAERRRLVETGVELIRGPVGDFHLETDGISFTSLDGRRTFDAVYPALGSVIHSDLASAVGAECTEEGCIRVDAHQRTSIIGLYAAGDVVIGLDQISHAMGEAGVAATAIRNDLADRAPRLR